MSAYITLLDSVNLSTREIFASQRQGEMSRNTNCVAQIFVNQTSFMSKLFFVNQKFIC